MTITQDARGYTVMGDVSYLSKASGRTITIKGTIVAAAIVKANIYLSALKKMFNDMGFDIYSTLGQRNLSGFVGEVFGRTLNGLVQDMEVNPHPDGRPDLIDLSGETTRRFYEKECFSVSENGDSIPIRSELAPFKFGGIEIKSSIGSPVSSYKKGLEEELGVTEFKVGMERVKYLESITFWGHHASCENLLGLYYDYPKAARGAPQFMAALFARLDPAEDWHKVSIGKAGSKKTSNTSLSATGKEKIYHGTVAVTKDRKYLAKLGSIGVLIEPE